MLREPGVEAPTLFTTRWAMAYLRGPLTREQISTLMADSRMPTRALRAPSSPPQTATGAAPAAAATATAGATAGTATQRARAPAPDHDAVPVVPAVAEGVPVRWLDPAAPWAAQVGIAPGGAAATALAPALVARVSLLFDDDRLALRETVEWEAVVYPLAQTVDPTAAVAVDHDDRDLRTEAPADATYRVTDAPLKTKKYFSDAERALADHLYRTRTSQVLRNRTLKLASRTGESADEFAARCQVAADDAADRAQVALQQRYEARIAKARDALGAAADRAQQARAAEQTRRSNELATGAGSLLGAVLGGRRSARSLARDLGRVLTGRSRGDEAAQRVQTADHRVRDKQAALAALEADLARDLTAIDDEWRAKAADVVSVDVPLEKSDIRVTSLSLVWVPAG
jgi:hypothetical protein